MKSPVFPLIKNKAWFLFVLLCATIAPGDGHDACWNLFHLVDNQSEEGFILAPLPATDLFAALSFGSAGKTEAEFQKVFFQGMDKQDLVNLAVSTTREKYGFKSITGFWKSKELNLLETYQNTTREKWDIHWGTAPLRNAPSQSADQINNWFAAQTNQVVRKVIEPADIADNTDLIGINVCRFKAPWAWELFPAMLSNVATFYASKTEKFPVAMMHGQFEVPYYQDQDVKASSLPFDGGDLSLLLILPQQPMEFDRIKTKLDADRFEKIITGLKLQKLAFSLPKVKASMRLDLRKILIQSGLRIPFTPTADTDFQYINGNNPEPLYLSRAQQQLEVSWDEKGVTASAFTSIGGDPFGEMPTPDPNSFQPFVVNHPFIFVIYTTDKKEMVFAGVISEPTQMTVAE